MAGTSAIPYGNENPRGIDPFPIESTLAGIVGANNPAQASILLDQYRFHNQVVGDQYQAALQQQHDAALAAIHAQMQDTMAKAAPEYAAKGILGLLPGVLPDATSGTDPSVLADAIARTNAGQTSGTFKNVGEGISAARTGGAMPNLTGINNQYGLNLTPVDPIRVEAEKVAANARLGAASIAANAAQNPSSTVVVDTPYGKMNLAFPRKMNQAQVYANLDARGIPRLDPAPANAALPPPPPLTMAQPDTPATPPVGQTNLPPAQTSRPNTTNTMPTNEQAGAAAARQTVLANIDRIQTTHPDVYNDIKAGMAKNGGVPQVQQDASGKWHAVGASGNPY